MAQIERQQTVLNILRDLRDLGGLKKLFWEELNYERENQPLSMRGWPDSARGALADDPVLFASGGEDRAFHVVYCRLASAGLQRNLERPIVNQLIREHPYCLFVFSDTTQSAWHFLNVKYDEKAEKRRLFRRMTVQADSGLRTAAERLQMMDLALMGKELFGIPALEVQKRHDDAFDVEQVTKAFYKELANWYFWALRHVRFPKDAPKEADGHDHIGVIRMITRLIFCWFVKEKGLIPPELFDQRRLNELLDGFAPEKDTRKESVFFKAILQNLFFATLNTEMDKRGWVKDEQNFMAHSLYRYRDLFQKPGEALALFKNIPFLNGGLFECLDKDLGDNARPRYVRIDGFSRRSDSQPVVPDFLFFGSEREEDLSADYGDRKFKKVRVRGLIHTLQQYHFTIEENTPIEQEVALDPELSGKVFENLLAAYNPETGATARKQTGSFYTPREIVDYMVDEALIAFLKGGLPAGDEKATEEKLRRLASWEESGHDFDDRETESLIAAIDGLKALDPAVGSGAFPMGILHKLVFILGKLDPQNKQWEQRQIQRVRDAVATAEKIEDAAIRERTVREMEQQIVGIEEAFERNELDYGRKLYLIENCLYGVDIQAIAVQIAKMRFFISLIVDQRMDPDAPNLGVRPLPNLETKFVAANTLIGIEKPKQGAFRNPDIDAKEADLRKVREKHFNARTLAGKAKFRGQDKNLRAEIAELLKRDGWGDTTAKRLADWDPYDQNATAPFFDPEWMFGIREGFDVVIGNPPYGAKFSEAEKHTLLRLFRHQDYQLDSYLLFIERAFDLLSPGGIVDFIIPNPWLTNLKLKKIRRFLFTEKSIQEIAHYSRKVFDAVVDNEVVIIRNEPPYSNSVTVKLVSEGDSSVRVVEQSKWATLEGEPVNIFFDPSHEAIIEKVMSNTVLLKDLCIVTVGMKPYQVGKGVPTQTRATVDNRVFDATICKDKSYRALLRGRDIDKYTNKWDGNRWIKYGDHLAEPRPSAGFDALEKIVIRQTGDSLIATLDRKQFVCMNNMHTIVQRDGNYDLRFILGLLNSRLLNYYFQWLNPEKGEALAEVKKEHVEKLIIKRPSEKQHKDIVAFVSHILAAKAADPAADTSAMEREIDRIVYELYDLTEEEITIVEGKVE
ncbi:MAG: Eco57I restriction-modification methylase domain-containing protein [Deltaproteobacteria bacterium]|nr:Eco57I restriction-modification methylase domain-containing protein [Deltaproteobacteria bacterium]